MFNKSKIIIGFFIGLTLLVNTACSNASLIEKSTASTNVKLTSDEKKIYVGFLLDTLKDERWYKDKALFEEHIVSLGGNVKTLAANGLDDVQIKQAELLIDEGADVLVVVPHDAEVSATIVKLAHKAGIKVISYDRLIRNAELDYYISFDNEKVGEIQATEVLNQVTKGSFAYIGGAESDNNAILFRQGAMNVLQPFIDKGEINLVYDQYTKEWEPKIAEKNMLEALKKGKNQIDAVIAANDGTAGGVIQSLSTIGLAGKIPVSGQDAELAGIHRIIEGTQTMTVYKPIPVLAAEAAEMAIKVGKGEQIDTNNKVNNGQIDVPSVLLEPVAVTKDNIVDTVIKDGYLTEEEVYK
ncbi:sugar ABC transporter substrate-binding protein [Lederbergia lenta]|uniref:D-xylose-binding protein n=1 Tax=Lederbergia lenta TaxID=1467 RepID=A0A2X4WKU2_LEDLE|nr:substrate-binding domain-containing protein [Lederbergia lenta]MEC2326153.1 substrate-binding domain-containing protein [Lederbergia lenta]SQI63559.1 D-xylose-binding protein [Lederbergia lenta]